MDYREEKSIIRKRYFSTLGLIANCIFSIIGIFMIYYSKIFFVYNLESFYEVIYINGIILMIGAVFLLISIYVWIGTFLNLALKPKKEILYVYKKEDDELYFVDKKGKKYIYDLGEDDIKVGHYYYVIKTRDYIAKVLERTSAIWSAEQKMSYWMNFYSPFGNLENMCLLPVPYIILLIGLSSFLLAKGFNKIYGALFSVVPLYIIIYDLIYKTKLRNNAGKEVDETNFEKSYIILKRGIVITIISFVLYKISAFYLFIIEVESNMLKLIFTLILIGIFSGAAWVIYKIFKEEE